MKQTTKEIFTGRDGRQVAAEVPCASQDSQAIHGGSPKSDTFYS